MYARNYGESEVLYELCIPVKSSNYVVPCPVQNPEQRMMSIRKGARVSEIVNFRLFLFWSVMNPFIRFLTALCSRPILVRVYTLCVYGFILND